MVAAILKPLKSIIFLNLLFATLSMHIFSSSAFATEIEEPNDSPITEAVKTFAGYESQHTFYGLASYYNKTSYFLVDEYTFSSITKDTILKDGQWIALSNRYNVLVIQAAGLAVKLVDGKVDVDDRNLSSVPTIIFSSKDQLFKVAPELDQIRFNHLWAPLAYLSRLIEVVLVAIQRNIVESWGWTIVIFTILLKLFMLPVGIMTTKFQRRVSLIQSKLAPQLSSIKATYDGEEAHNRIMAAHEELGVSPFYSLKPMLALFIQIPVLIAIFNALGEMPQFEHQSFLWIENLAYPDVIRLLPVKLFMFGNSISILPILMTIVTISSTMIFQNSHASIPEVKRQKRNLYLMAAAFFILFYPFPAVMVLYWTLANFLHLIQQQIIKI